MTVITKVAVPALLLYDDVVLSPNSCWDGLKAYVILNRISSLEKVRMKLSFHADVVVSATFHYCSLGCFGSHACNGVAKMG